MAWGLGSCDGKLLFNLYQFNHMNKCLNIVVFDVSTDKHAASNETVPVKSYINRFVEWFDPTHVSHDDIGEMSSPSLLKSIANFFMNHEKIAQDVVDKANLSDLAVLVAESLIHLPWLMTLQIKDRYTEDDTAIKNWVDASQFYKISDPNIMSQEKEAVTSGAFVSKLSMLRRVIGQASSSINKAGEILHRLLHLKSSFTMKVTTAARIVLLTFGANTAQKVAAASPGTLKLYFTATALLCSAPIRSSATTISTFTRFDSNNGACSDSNGAGYPYMEMYMFTPGAPTFSKENPQPCFDWCAQVHTDKLVGVTIGPAYTTSQMCWCSLDSAKDLSGVNANQYNNPVPVDPAGWRSYGGGTGPVGSIITSWSGVWCWVHEVGLCIPIASSIHPVR